MININTHSQNPSSHILPSRLYITIKTIRKTTETMRFILYCASNKMLQEFTLFLVPSFLKQKPCILSVYSSLCVCAYLVYECVGTAPSKVYIKIPTHWKKFAAIIRRELFSDWFESSRYLLSLTAVSWRWHGVVYCAFFSTIRAWVPTVISKQNCRRRSLTNLQTEISSNVL